jgi:hypothetical protein
VRPEGLGKFKIHLIGYRIRDLPVCSIEPSVRRPERSINDASKVSVFAIITRTQAKHVNFIT